MERQLRGTNQTMSQQIGALRQEIGREFGWATRVTAGVLGPVLLFTSRREQKRLDEGQTYEPKTFIERRNWRTPADIRDIVCAPSKNSTPAELALHAG
jgi:hypothetical protein